MNKCRVIGKVFFYEAKATLLTQILMQICSLIVTPEVCNVLYTHSNLSTCHTKLQISFGTCPRILSLLAAGLWPVS